VLGRNPVHTRIALSPASPGMYAPARSIIRPRIARSTRRSRLPYCRDDPIRTCPVYRGCTLNATESAVVPCALVRYPSSTS
jgi:hypothetical protein